MRPRLLALGLVWLATVAATPVLPLRPPAPDLAALVPFVTAPLDKPPVPLPDVPFPPPPVELPPVPSVPITLPGADKPMAELPPPRSLPCLGTWASTSEALVCGRARMVRGEWEAAARVLHQAAQGADDPDLLQEARYWLGEVYYRLDRFDDADLRFRQVIRLAGPSEFKPWAMLSSGWTALRQNDPRRAQETFAQLLGAPHPALHDGWARYGLALSLMKLGQWPEAERTWAELIVRRPPPELEREAAFWHAETLVRLDQPGRAADEFQRFVSGGSHPLLEPAIVRLGWSRLNAGQHAQAITAFRAYGGSRERDLVDTGLALALLATGDWPGARTAARALESRRSSMAIPVLLRLAASAVGGARTPEGLALVQEMIGAQVTPPVRAWLLLLNGEAQRHQGNLDEARTQFELARTLDPAPPIGPQATVRAARVNFEAREFPRVTSDLAPLLATALTPELRLPALLVRAEAAYRAGDYTAAATDLQSAIGEFPQRPETTSARFALAWATLRRGQADGARQQFLDYARAYPSDPHAVDALVLASELTLASGDLRAARDLLDSIVMDHRTHPRVDFARLNRAILLIRLGQPVAAQPILRDWVRRAPFPPLLGRAEAALGVALLASDSPVDAARAFEAAQHEGLGALASLGLGAAALERERWDEAAKHLAEARDTGTATIAAAAEYGLGVVALRKGRFHEFKAPALALLQAQPRARGVAAILYALAAIEADEKDWTAALGHAKRLVADFPTDAAADDALERVGSASVRAAAWPVAVEAYDLLRQRFPLSPFVASSQVAYAEALLATGRAVDARRELERFVGTAPSDPRAPTAWIALARAREATGDRRGALEAYQRAERDTRTEWTKSEITAHARLLVDDKRGEQARRVLERLLRASDRSTAVEGAVAIAETFQSENQALPAAEYYMTAAYLAPTTAEGRKALLAAARSFAALKQADAAAIVYKKLLAQADLPADLATAARQGLAELGR